MSGSFQGQRPAGSDGVAKFPRLVGQVLGGNRIFNEVPALVSAGEQEFELQLMSMLPSGDGVGIEPVFLDIVAFHFFQNFVGAADVFVFDIDDRIDEMLVLERTKAILPAEPGEKSAVVKGGLAVEVELGGPPGGSAIFELHPESMEVVAAALGAEGGEVFNLEVAGFFEVMIVGDDVGIFLSAGSRNDEISATEDENEKQGRAQQEFSFANSLQQREQRLI